MRHVPRVLACQLKSRIVKPSKMNSLLSWSPSSRSSGLRVIIFSSAGRPPPLVRAEEVSAPPEGSIRTTRRAPMRAEVEAHALLVAKHLLACRLPARGREVQVGPVPRPLQQRRSTYGEATFTQREMCNFRQRAPGGRVATCWPLWTPGQPPRDCSLQTTAGSFVSHFLAVSLVGHTLRREQSKE